MKRVVGRVVGVAVLCALWSCDEEPTRPLAGAGAGIRLIFPEASGIVQGVRVTLLDPDNTFILPDCQELARRSWSPIIPQTLEGDCDSQEVHIRDLIGTPVRDLFCASPPESACNIFWDGRDEDGNVVPDGYYYYHLRCVKPDSVSEWERGMYVLSQSECDWPLWGETLESLPANRTVELSPFPVSIDLPLLDAGSGTIETVHFVNPFRIRVEAPNMEDFEQNVTLVEGKYTDVNVTLVQLKRMR